MRRLPLAAIASLGLVLSPAASSAETLYSVRTLDAPNFTPNAFGDDGRLAGYESLGQFIAHAALFDGDEVLDLGTLGGETSVAHGLGASGHVVGESLTEEFLTRAFVWDCDTMTELPSLGGSSSIAYAVNSSGIIVGYSGVPETQHGQALRWKDAALTELGTLGGFQSVALDVNEVGQIVGWSWDASLRPRAFLWEGDLEATPPQGTMTDLGALEGGEAFANAINNVGQVVGRSVVLGTSNLQRATLWEDGEVINLGRLRDTDNGSEARAINDGGQIVGRSGSRAFLWEERTLHDLDDRLAPDSSAWDITDAIDINEDGWILGRGRLGAFSTNLLLVPVPEPEAQWLAGLTGLALTAAARRRRAVRARSVSAPTSDLQTPGAARRGRTDK